MGLRVLASGGHGRDLGRKVRLPVVLETLPALQPHEARYPQIHAQLFAQPLQGALRAASLVVSLQLLEFALYSSATSSSQFRHCPTAVATAASLPQPWHLPREQQRGWSQPMRYEQRSYWATAYTCYAS